MLKFSLRKEHLDFTIGWKTSEKEMKDNDAEEDLLQRLLYTNFQDKIDLIMRSADKYEN